MTDRHLVIMLKEPLPGRVKTRLARDIGKVASAWWFRHQTSKLLRELDGDPRWKTWLAISPDAAVGTRFWPKHQLRFTQGQGDLGDRMGRVFRTLPAGPAIIIGGDIPGVRRRHIATAFRELGGHDGVLGPAPDGGYWLIGLMRCARPMPKGLFEGVRWSSQTTMADTVRSFGPQAKIATTTTLRDVDTVADLRELNLQQKDHYPIGS